MSATSSILDNIRKTLDQIQIYELSNEVVSPSKLSANNRYRHLVKSIRDDLQHLDGEKKRRIIFTLHLEARNVEGGKASPEDTSEWNEALSRILEIVENFQKSQIILLSPEKKKTTQKPEEAIKRHMSARRLTFD